MDSLYSTLFGIMMGSNCRGEVVGRDEVGEYTIDTCYTVDQGWETAVWKGTGTMIVVARYPDKDMAAQGHQNWVETCAQNPIGAFSVQNDEWELF